MNPRARENHDGPLLLFLPPLNSSYCYRIADLVGWQAEHTIEEAIASALAWTEKRQEILGYE